MGMFTSMPHVLWDDRCLWGTHLRWNLTKDDWRIIFPYTHSFKKKDCVPFPWFIIDKNGKFIDSFYSKTNPVDRIFAGAALSRLQGGTRSCIGSLSILHCFWMAIISEPTTRAVSASDSPLLGHHARMNHLSSIWEREEQRAPIFMT